MRVVTLFAVPVPAVDDLAVVETGTDGPLIVFVHGVLDRGRSFGLVARHLRDGHRMVWYDRRGYGRAVDAPGGPPDVAGHADDLLAVIDGRECVVVGHSFGGVTALVAAQRAPELVRAVVIYETGMAWLPQWDDSALGRFLWDEDAEAEAVRLMFGDRVDSMSPAQWERRLVEARAFVVEERSVRMGQDPVDLSALTQPLVYGASDDYRFGFVAEHLRSVVADVQTRVFSGAGHNAHRSQPEAFAELVRAGVAVAFGDRG